jgi:ABC-type transport system involved in multi-copper enzyme maturation permease subunit
VRDLVRSELAKIGSTRLWWGLLIAAAVFTAVQAGAQAALAGVDAGAGQAPLPGLDTPEAMRAVYAAAAFTGSYVFAMILGITGMTGEYRYQTVSATFLASPRRSRVVVAKMLAHLLYGAGYGLAALLAAGVVGSVVIVVRGHAVDLAAEGVLRGMLLTVVAVGLWTMVGLGIGTMIRNQVAAILVGVLLAYILEPVLSLLLHSLHLDGVARYLPTNASAALTEPSRANLDYLAWWAGGLVLLGYALAFAALGVLLSRRRDIS